MEARSSKDDHWYRQVKRLISKPHRRSDSNKPVEFDINQQDDLANQIDLGLGPYANEKRMPRWLIRVLQNGDKIVSKDVRERDGTKKLLDLKIVETPNLVPVLAHISNVDPSVVRASYCDPRVHHVAKLRREGSFCGYRNIQMMVSYVCNAEFSGYQQFESQPLPSIFQLQDLIESAWEKGFNSSSRDDIGPIRMTRKFIGTSEVEALFQSLEIPVSTRAFVSTSGIPAYQCLTQYVANYFRLAEGSHTEKVVITHMPPIFLQRPGHSLTIVGIEESASGSHQLVVFDPKYRASTALIKLALGGPFSPRCEKLIQPHRYGLPDIAEHEAFEVVLLHNSAAANT